MDRTMPSPDVLSTQVPIESLIGTARTIATLAAKAGYSVKAARALGPRVPRRVNDPIYRQSLTIVIGERGAWRFKAHHSQRDGWQVTLHRPGWPTQVGNTSILMDVLKAQLEDVEQVDEDEAA